MKMRVKVIMCTAGTLKAQSGVCLLFSGRNTASAKRLHLIDHFLPHLEPLRPIFNCTIESQILYHAPLSFEPSYSEIPGIERGKAVEAAADMINSLPDHDQKTSMEAAVKGMEDEQGNGAWVVDREQMTIFVNSEKWSLGETIFLRFNLGCRTDPNKTLEAQTIRS